MRCMFYGARSHFPSSKQHIHNLHISYLHNPMQKSGVYVNTKHTKATYRTAVDPEAVPDVDASSSDICGGT